MIKRRKRSHNDEWDRYIDEALEAAPELELVNYRQRSCDAEDDNFD